MKLSCRMAGGAARALIYMPVNQPGEIRGDIEQVQPIVGDVGADHLNTY